MTTSYSNTVIDFMNRKQLRAIARNTVVAAVTEHSTFTTVAALITAIKAK